MGSPNDHHIAADGSLQAGLGRDEPPKDLSEFALWTLRRIIREQRETVQAYRAERDLAIDFLGGRIQYQHLQFVNLLADLTEQAIRASIDPKIVSLLAQQADLAAAWQTDFWNAGQPA